MKTFNAAMTGLFDLLFYPFRGLDPIWALLAISLVAGALMLWLFGKVSNQDVIHEVRDRIRGNLLAVRLFGDDIGLMFRLQGRILGQTLSYLRHAFIPVLIMMLPVILMLTQMNLRFAVRPLEPGERTVIKALLNDPADVYGEVSLESPEGVEVEVGPVRAAPVREVAWRIRADTPGRYDLVVRIAGGAVEKEVQVGGSWGATSSRRTGAGFWDLLLYPGEDPIAGDDAVARVDVLYPPRELSMLGFGINWLIFFFIASIVFGFALRKPLGVEI